MFKGQNFIMNICLYLGYNPNFVYPDFSNFGSDFPSLFNEDGSALNAIRSLAGGGASGFSGQPGGHGYQGGSGGLGAGHEAGYNG